ncbi:MAG: helix-turn-helix transcriptional regulator [Paludibacterium sp.]|uniref:helix-turn-helix domain-containing protein n=1 Tax=Paludibacterium sp. TaxID=1917523 RepID=UPI0025F74BF7|nr:helix-turn-helix transcriptional regulator [Paludibacterium sp.]MBV8048083.1 helix-turn-helix transcriptional regulator [Paludibacterium sp.]
MENIYWNSDRDTAFGVRIAKARNAKGWSLAQLADRLNVSRAMVGHWEKGNRAIKHADLATLCQILGVSADELLFGIRRWPFEKVDFESIRSLDKSDIDRLEGALIITASQLEIDIKQNAA